MLVLLKNHLIYLIDIFECFFRKCNRLIFLKKVFTTYNDEKLSLKKENIMKDKRNIFRLKKNKITLQLNI